MSQKHQGDTVEDFVGPLGQKAPIHKVKRVLDIGSGVGIAPLYPQLKKMKELGDPDSSGRRRPTPIENSDFVIDVETVIIAIGQTPNPLIRQTTSGLDTKSWKWYNY